MIDKNNCGIICLLSEVLRLVFQCRGDCISPVIITSGALKLQGAYASKETAVAAVHPPTSLYETLPTPYNANADSGYQPVMPPLYVESSPPSNREADIHPLMTVQRKVSGLIGTNALLCAIE